MATADQAQLVVVGGGPGGYAAAFHAADLGLRVTLIDPEKNPGGVCLYRGCIPSKALLHVAGVIAEAKEAAAAGVSFGAPKIDLDALRAFKGGVVERLTGGLGQLSRARKITYVQGRARFTAANTLEVTGPEGTTTSLDFTQAIIATGSRAATLRNLPDDERVMNSRQALDLPEVPKRLLVVGGGYIGVEMASVYAALGARVTIVELTGGLLPGADRDLVKPLEIRIKGVLEALWLNTKVTSAKVQGKTVTVEVEGPDGKKKETFDRLLVAVGRVPNTKDIGLEALGITVDDHGFVPVDLARRTKLAHIFAIGDVAGQPMLAHKASHEGQVAAAAAAGKKVAFEPQAIPAVVFTDPEVAWCGLTEEDAKRSGVEVKVGKFPWAASGRALTMGRSDGLTKVVAEAASGRVLGVGVVGPGAGELIAEGVLAVEMAAVAEDLALSIHPHPTLSETLMESAASVFGKSLHYLGR